MFVSGNDPTELLNKLLHLELTAVVTYRHTVPRIRNKQFKATAQHCYDLHRQACEKLQRRLGVLGCPFPTRAGILQWLSAVFNLATIFGDHAIRASLRKSEMYRLEEYEYELTCLDGENLRLVQEELIEIQESICLCLKGVQL